MYPCKVHDTYLDGACASTCKCIIMIYLTFNMPRVESVPQDYFVDGVNSVLAQGWTADAVADSMMPLLVNESFRTSLGTRARQYVIDHFSMEAKAPHAAAVLR